MSASTNLVESLIAVGRVSANQVVGCSEQEIANIEARFGYNLPGAYKDFLRTLGKGAGKFQNDCMWKYPELLEDVPEATRGVLDNCNGTYKHTIELPKTAFVFLESGGSQIMFFDTADGDDPPVFLYEQGNQQATKWADSFSSWVAEYSNGIRSEARKPD